MNKNLYRIVFNKARGMLMVVADIAASGRGSSGPSSGMGHTLSQHISALSRLNFSLLLALGCVSVSVQAGIVADGSAAGKQQPTVINSANGTPQINIQTPNSNGVSHNKYSQFDIDGKGAILNNSHNATQTQLGGMVNGNPWLAKSEAKIILNEVNSRNPSQLNGVLEVAGKKAQIIIANPAGITCEGCGFINANRTTLTTGAPQFSNGQITGYDVRQGEIVIQGRGMDTTSQDSTDIIARAVKVNAGIWANDLKVTTGSNVVNAAHETITRTTPDTNTRPQLAVDVSQLGGMYAGKIRLIGTETGVGVRNAGAIGTSAGNVTITADGRIENSGAINSVQDLSVSASGGIQNSGVQYASGNTTFSTPADIVNSGTMAAAHETTLNAGSLNSSTSGVLAAGMNSDGKLGNSGDLTLTTSGQLSAHGQNLAANSLNAKGAGVDFSQSQTWARDINATATTGNLSTAQGNIAAAQTLTLNTRGLLNNDGGRLEADRLVLGGSTLSNQSGVINQLGEHDLSLTQTTAINNNDGTIASNSHNLTLNTAKLTNRQGSIIHAGSGKLALNTAQVDATGGTIASNGALDLQGKNLVLDSATTQADSITVNADSLSHHAGNMTQTGSGKMTLTVSGGLDNSQGNVASNGDVALAAGSLKNQQGQLLSAGHALTLTSAGAVDNRSGFIAADGLLNISSSSLDNSAGLMQSGSTFTLNTHGGALVNQNSGNQGGIISLGDLTLSSGNIDNQHGTLYSGDNAWLTTGSLNNTAGQLVSVNALTWSGQTLQNDNGGVIQSGGSLVLDTHGAALSNTHSGESGGITSGGKLTVKAGEVNNQSGTVYSADSTWLNTGNWNNTAGLLVGVSGLNFSGGKLINDNGGLIQSGAELVLETHGEQISNTRNGNIISQGDLHLSAGDVSNHSGTVYSGANVWLSTGSWDNNAGQLAGVGSLSFSGNALWNDNGGFIQSGGNLTLDTHGAALSNIQNGTISSAKDLQLSAGDVNNQAGVVYSAGNAQFATGSWNNTAGLLAGVGSLSYSGSTLRNDNGGAVQSGGELLLDTHGALLSNKNSGKSGGITSQGSMTLNSGALDNELGAMISNQHIALNTAEVNNDAGLLVALQGLDAATGEVSNHGGAIQSGASLSWNTRGNSLNNLDGLISAQNSLTLNSGDVANQQGLLTSGGDFTLTSGYLDNRNGHIAGKSDLALNSTGINNQHGGLQSLGDMVLNATHAIVDNTAGLIQSAQQIVMNAQQVVNLNTHSDDQSLGIQGGNIVVTADTFNNLNGDVLANNSVGLNLGGQLNNSHGLITAMQLAQIRAGSVINSQGDIETGSGLTINSTSLTGDGKLLSLGDMSLGLASDFTNAGTIQANGNLDFTTSGNVTNQNLMQAGDTFTLHAASLNNTVDGELSAGTLDVNVSGTLTNRGLLDGYTTHLSTQTLNNTGTGRIYGDWLSIDARTLNNSREGGIAATIAARQQLDIGVGVLNNSSHALIYSDGNMYLGGSLDENWLATGQAIAINNHSATIESAGNMRLNVATLNNINDHFTTENVLVSQEHISEYNVDRLGSQLYNENDYNISMYKDETWIICIEGVICNTTNGDKFTHYDYTRTITEDRVLESDPAQIISGGTLTINAGDVLNDKSQIVAGGNLNINATNLNNVEVPGQRQILDEGTATRYKRKQSKGGDSPSVKTSDYTPPAIIQEISLNASTVADHSQAGGSGLTVDAHQETSVSGTIQGGGNLSMGDIAGPNGAGALASGPVGSVTIPGINGGPSMSLSPGKTFEVNLPGDSQVVRMVGPNTRIPDNSLFKSHPESNSPYLVETDPRFTNKKQWLSSDYMMNAFITDPNNIQKRLGDGFYEQRLIREQVVALTGQRYIGNTQSDEEQYKMLMDNGIAFGQLWGLKPGVALTPEQMSALTSDIVWMVSQTVQMPDGSTQQVLVPQVYAKVKPGDLDGSGALLAGRNVNLNLSGDLTNSGRINSKDNTLVLANNINNLGGIISGNDVALQARTDINNIGGTIQGGDSLLAIAGRDINVTTTTRSAVSADGNFGRTSIDRIGSMSVSNDGGFLGMQAGRDVNLTAALISNGGEDSQTTVIAGNNLNLNTVETGSHDSLSWGRDDWLKRSQSSDTGTVIQGGGNVSMGAGHDVNITAGTVSANQQLTIQAGNDLNIVNGTSSDSFEQYTKQTGSSSMTSKTTTVDHNRESNQLAVGSQLDGDGVTLSARHDLLVQGSSVAGSQDVNLIAGNNLTVTAATEQHDEMHQHQEKKSGLSGTGGIGISYGTNDLKTTDTGTSLTSAGSTVGSINGDVNMVAGNGLTIKGSDVLAGNDIALQGKQVDILAADNDSSSKHTVEQSSSGLTLALSGSVGSAINQAVTSANTANKEKESNGRMAALDGMKAALSGVQAYQGNELNQAQGGDPAAVIGINLSYGSQSSKSEQTQTNHDSQGSTIQAGNNLSIKATDSDVNVTGSQIRAGNDITLDAARDVNLISAENTHSLEGKNESHGGSVGVGINFGSGSNGISVNASVNKGKGSETGNGTTHTETTIDAGNNLTIVSGRDTTLTGAQISGDKVTMDVGRDLTLTSERDSDQYDSKQQNASAGGSASMGGGSGSINLSQDKMHSNYDAVQEQTGIFAGKGGFDITVGEHTQLNGAVISSTSAPENNLLDTGTLGFSNIDNHAEYEVEHQSAGISSGGGYGDQFLGNMANGLLVGANGEGSADSTTKSAISDGTITIRDKDKQRQNIDDLSRDVANANPGLDVIFDKEKEQRRLQEIQAIGEIGSQAADIVRTQGQIEATKKATEKMKTVTPEEREAAKAQWQKEHPEKPVTDEDINGQLFQNAYNEAFDGSKYGTGGSIQQGLQAATAAIQGLAGGDMAKALAGGSAPYLAEMIHDMTTDPVTGKVNTEANLIAHAVVGAVVAQINGNSALAGASGAVAGEYIAQQLYPDIPRDKLTEEQKQTISALSTLAAGIIGGLVGDSTADAVAGAQAGKNAAENNNLSLLARGCAIAAPCRTKVAEQLLEIGAKAGMVGLAGAAIKNMAGKMTSDELDHLLTLEMMGNDEITGKYLSSLQDKYGSGDVSAPNMAKDLTDAEKAELGGVGSGTGTPPENDPKQQNKKSEEKLNQKQESAIKKIDNTIKNAIKDHDITGTLKDMDGNPVPKENGGYWDHMQEMQNTLRGLRNHADTLKNVNNPEAQAAYGRATDAINKIESALKGHGI
ncbi:hemagglutinin repeat-containing protein [Lelliottia wanjuensis]|uniref:Hemagglutinin repeat-containing protein n=1 Tax=Lelliottia wanjuensis TaxID=3050585 RepID=A0AAP4D5Y2_9ENTR|nr:MULTISPECIES: hemagglutinin repeat-containing protein [unclassified Lelliottia]MDK9365009.1 hemagglutinin repeat-containing protein [Lelliottia sp. V106_12]MDK9618803.1 hemagglutinin repeat-containing protein [Lelliottia sp. V106_9]